MTAKALENRHSKNKHDDYLFSTTRFSTVSLCSGVKQVEYLIPAVLVLLKAMIKSPLVLASIVGFIAAFKARGLTKKYLMGGCTLVFIAYLAELVFNVAMPAIWNAEGLNALEISKSIVRYSRIFEVVSAAGLLMVVRSAFMSEHRDA